MGRRRRQQLLIASRRDTVARLYLRGWRQMQIATHLGVSQSTVSTDLRAIEEQWRESAVQNIDQLKQREVETLFFIQQEACDAWEESKKPKQSAFVVTDGDRQRTEKRVSDQHGDSRLLDVAQKCVAQRRAVFGLDAPKQSAMSDSEQRAAEMDFFDVALKHLTTEELHDCLGALRRLQDAVSEAKASGGNSGSVHLRPMPRLEGGDGWT